MGPERLGPGARKRDLPDGGGGLRLLQAERAGAELEHSAAERDGAGGDDEQVSFVLVQGGDVGGERVEPVALERAGILVDKQRRADLDDDAAEGREARCLRRLRHGLARC